MRRFAAPLLAALLPLAASAAPPAPQGSPSPAPAASQADRDGAEIEAYRLTTDTLRKVAKVYAALDAKASADPALQARLDALATAGAGESPATLNGAVRRFESVPEMAAAIRAAGLDTREFVVFTVAFGAAGVGAYAVSQGAALPPDLPAAVRDNIRWFGEHREEIDRVKAEMEALEAKHRAPSPRP